MEETIFNFNIQNKRGFWEIIYGKGTFFSQTILVLAVVFILGFLNMPWKMEPELVLFRCLILIIFLFIILQYYKAIVRVSFDENYFCVKIWKDEHKYLIKDISRIKITYSRLWSSATLSIETGRKNRRYCLWAPIDERERYDLFLDMKDYIKDRMGGKVEIVGVRSVQR